MAHNPQIELTKRAAELAKEKHPDGFNKAQLIDASKEVFGGFGADPRKPIRTMEDVGHMQNRMAHIDGNYPLGMSGCEVVGINGGCGLDCPVFRDGDCKETGDLLEAVRESDDLDDEEKTDLLELYGVYDDDEDD